MDFWVSIESDPLLIVTVFSCLNADGQMTRELLGNIPSLSSRYKVPMDLVWGRSQPACVPAPAGGCEISILSHSTWGGHVHTQL